MLMPPEAEPVMPASRLTAMAREISGLSPPTEVTQRLIASKAASEAITEPKPTRLAVLKIGNSEALAPLSRVVVSASRRSEEHTSELQSRPHLVCRLLLEKKKTSQQPHI